MVEITSKGCQHMVEDTCSTICTEISSKFLESMSLSGPSGVGLMALYGNDHRNSLLYFSLIQPIFALRNVWFIAVWIFKLWLILVLTCLVICVDLLLVVQKANNLLLNAIWWSRVCENLDYVRFLLMSLIKSMFGLDLPLLFLLGSVLDWWWGWFLCFFSVAR